MADKVFHDAAKKFRGQVCGYCGKPVDGFAKVNDVWLCHPDDESKPDCYTLYQYGRMIDWVRSLPEGLEIIFHA